MVWDKASKKELTMLKAGMNDHAGLTMDEKARVAALEKAKAAAHAAKEH